MLHTPSRVTKWAERNKYKPGEKYVTIVLDGISTDTKRNFRCPECGAILFQYNSNLKIFFEGRIMDIRSGAFLDFLCASGGCKTIYRVVNL